MNAQATSREIRFQRHITAAMAAGTELATVLSLVTRAAARLSHADTAAIAALINKSLHQEIELRVAFGAPPRFLGMRVPVSSVSFSSLVITQSRSVRTSDVVRDRRSAVREISRISGVRAILAVPIRNAQEPFGTLTVCKRIPWHFSDQDETLLRRFADMASIAFQNTDLCQRLTSLGVSSDGAPLAAAAAADATPSRSGAAGDRGAWLSSRQRDVVRLLIAGKTSREIASALGLSNRTVEHHVERLKKRFCQARLPALVGYAVAHGLLFRSTSQ